MKRAFVVLWQHIHSSKAGLVAAARVEAQIVDQFDGR
jgi:hypothetical protein